MIFINPWQGNDANDGTSAKLAVRSWERTKALHQQITGGLTTECDLVFVHRDGTYKKGIVQPRVEDPSQPAVLPKKFQNAIAGILK